MSKLIFVMLLVVLAPLAASAQTKEWRGQWYVFVAPTAIVTREGTEAHSYVPSSGVETRPCAFLMKIRAWQDVGKRSSTSSSSPSARAPRRSPASAPATRSTSTARSGTASTSTSSVRSWSAAGSASRRCPTSQRGSAGRRRSSGSGARTMQRLRRSSRTPRS